jgi:streptomycin 6-kinase
LTADRLELLARHWRVTLEETRETPTSILAFGRRGNDAVVVKVVKREGDEWRSGEVVAAFGGAGVVRVHEHEPGALLLERVEPGETLIGLVAAGRDDAAVSIIAKLVSSMQPGGPPDWCPTLFRWAEAFDWYLASGDSQIPRSLVLDAQRRFVHLAKTQRSVRLLHGDLQHSNIVFDRNRGWLSIDPKGVIGETAYEVAAALRNPRQLPALISDLSTIARRVDQFASQLQLDRGRLIGWAFANAVLSLIWSIQDSGRVDPMDPSRLVADALAPIADSR